MENLEKQISKITGEIIEFNKDLEGKENVVEKYVKMVVNTVLNYCNRSDLPIELADVIFMMTTDILVGNGFITREKNVTSIKRGDTSISYATSNASAESFMKNYTSQLVHYKKLRLPK